MNIQARYRFHLAKTQQNHLTFASTDEDVAAHVFILEEGIFRVLFEKREGLDVGQTWSIAPGQDDLPAEGRDRFSTEHFNLPAFELDEDEQSVTIQTRQLKAVIQKEGFRISWYQATQGQWQLFAQDRQTQAYNFAGELGSEIKHYLKRDIKEQYFGLGERTGQLDHHHGRYRNLTIDAMGYDAEYSDPLYKHIPFYITRKPEQSFSYGLFYDNLAPGYFDLGRELDNYHGLYRYFEAQSGDLDYYMIAGPRVRDVVASYTWMTGKTALPPKWSIGYSGSTMSYTDAPNAQEQVWEFIEQCEKHDILCDSFQLSSGYTSIDHKRYVFNWNTQKFPDAKKLSADFKQKGIRLAANIKPALLTDHPQYEKLEAQGYFLKDANGDTELAQFWDGGGAHIDFTHEGAYGWWKDEVTRQLLEYGIETTWNDNNEYEIWNKATQAAGFGTPLSFTSIRALFPLLMMKASFEAQTEYAPEKRPFLISRSGAPGMHRYVQTWTGDNRTEWKTIRFNNRTGLGLSLSGVFNVGHDVGGFAGPKPDQELFIRWVQNGIFHPRFTIHSWNEDATVNEPWMYEDAVAPIRELIKLRSKLTPYWYSAFYKAHVHHEPLIKPTFFDFEEDARTWQENDDFMVGESLLVASVVEPGVSTREVYAPLHADGWFDFYTGRFIEGGTYTTLDAPYHQTPLLVKAGAIIPINEAPRTFERKDEDQRGFLLFPPRSDDSVSSYTLFEDDGETSQWQSAHALVELHMRTSAEAIHVTTEVVDNGYRLPFETAIFTLATDDDRTLYINGEAQAAGQPATVAL
ncbi:glycoside hydrolase family 31 protein [Halomonas sp. GD1P12]|uniref:glycoside hydrolase family 31 protein n=1 Tax=Halomonas sp. GD1P12 TaxID=2982691 RepID=UPI0021E4B00B|nr:glycoside hydrolase family 31 protein [Halomonas sp. GD1P12]UYF98670.1 glycoside hydrolase family 31 protein [Halomonas sp. GD1P12]